MKLVIKCLVVLAFVAVGIVGSTTYAAGDLVVGGTIKQVVQTGDSGDSHYFSVAMNSGGTGPCSSDGTVIRFPKSVNDAAAAEKMFSMALAAHLSGKKVRIHSYQTGTDCEKAQYIRISD